MCWHVNDIKMSYAHKSAVDKLIVWLQDFYRDLHITRVATHDYLGVNYATLRHSIAPPPVPLPLPTRLAQVIVLEALD